MGRLPYHFRPPTSEAKVPQDGAFRSRKSPGARPEQSRAFLEMTREIEAAEEHTAADKLMERSANEARPDPQVAKLD